MTQSETSLYDALGGRDAVDAAVDIFYTKVLADDRVNTFFGDVDMPKQRAKQKIFLTYAFGGPVKYDGLDMRQAHKHLNLNTGHFQAIAEHLQATLEELNVPENLIGQVMTLVAGTHDDVLNL